MGTWAATGGGKLQNYGQKDAFCYVSRIEFANGYILHEEKQFDVV